MHLRAHLFAAASLALLLSPLAAAAQAGRSTDGIHIGGRRLSRPRVVLYATDNANTRYQLWVRWPRRGGCGEGVLRLGAKAITSDGWGSDSTSCNTSFALDASTADAAAAHFSIPRQDRHVLGRGLRSAFAPGRRVIRSGEDIEVVLSIGNPPGAPVVNRFVGGRQRGPRNNRFSFVVERDGADRWDVSGWPPLTW